MGWARETECLLYEGRSAVANEENVDVAVEEL